MAKKYRGRMAITLLKNEYQNGSGRFDNMAAITAFLLKHKIKANPHQAYSWDLTARKELADAKVSTTFPGTKNGFGRLANPTHGERAIPRPQSLKTVQTRLATELRFAKADAAQADATPIEKARVTLVTAAKAILDTVQ
jgi:hypothetical protein